MSRLIVVEELREANAVTMSYPGRLWISEEKSQGSAIPRISQRPVQWPLSAAPPHSPRLLPTWRPTSSHGLRHLAASLSSAASLTRSSVHVLVILLCDMVTLPLRRGVLVAVCAALLLLLPLSVLAADTVTVVVDPEAPASPTVSSCSHCTLLPPNTGLCSCSSRRCADRSQLRRLQCRSLRHPLVSRRQRQPGTAAACWSLSSSHDSCCLCLLLCCRWTDVYPAPTRPAFVSLMQQLNFTSGHTWQPSSCSASAASQPTPPTTTPTGSLPPPPVQLPRLELQRDGRRHSSGWTRPWPPSMVSSSSTSTSGWAATPPTRCDTCSRIAAARRL